MASEKVITQMAKIHFFFFSKRWCWTPSPVCLGRPCQWPGVPQSSTSGLGDASRELWVARSCLSRALLGASRILGILVLSPGGRA